MLTKTVDNKLKGRVMSKGICMKRTKATVARRLWAVVPVAILTFAALPAHAEGVYSKKVEAACKGDYQTHCPGYKEGSSALRNCMSLAGRRGNLSRRCVNALTDAGLVPRKYRKR